MFFHILLVQLKEYLILQVQHFYLFYFHNLIFYNDYEQLLIKLFLHEIVQLHNHLKLNRFLLEKVIRLDVESIFTFFFYDVHTKLNTLITNENCWSSNEFSYFMLALPTKRTIKNIFIICAHKFINESISLL